MENEEGDMTTPANLLFEECIKLDKFASAMSLNQVVTFNFALSTILKLVNFD